MLDTWNPKQYQKFAADRDLPFYDLLKLIVIKPNMTVIDLGCGTGKLTHFLHDTLKAKETLGIDSSPAMLQESSEFKTSSLHFQQSDIVAFQPTEKLDLIFSNAALQWVPNHTEIIKKLAKSLKKDGQIAIQVPANFDFPSHVIAQELSLEAPFKKYTSKGHPPEVHNIETYSTLFYQLGARKQNVAEHVYPHVLESTDSLIEWVKGSLLTYYQHLLPLDEYQHFLEQYTKRIHKHFGEQRPLFMPFKRILMWAQF